jgi:hypothetical protein
MNYDEESRRIGHPCPQDHHDNGSTARATPELCLRQHYIENERITREMVAEADKKSRRATSDVAANRHSEAEDAALLSDSDEIARREAENGLRQFTLALDIHSLSREGCGAAFQTARRSNHAIASSGP